MCEGYRRLYKFYPPEHAIENLRNSWLKVSLLTELNDPFEFNSLYIEDKKQRIAFKKAREKAWTGKGLISLSENWQSPLLWAHYAGNHSGFAFGFDVSERIIQKVKYRDEKINFNFFELSKSDRLSALEPLTVTKFSHWNYESEYRILVSLSDCREDAEKYFLPFNSDIVLKEIIVGMRCQKKSNEIRSACKGSVDIKYARPAFKTFTMTKQLSAKFIAFK